MALTETIEYDKIEVVGMYATVQVRKKHVVKKDGVQIASSFSRYTLSCGSIDESNNFVDNPLDKELDGVTTIPDNVKAVCNSVWTTDIKNAYKAHLIAVKNEFSE
jgi:hypothetical protein